jgi:hypothetical protein
MYRVLALSKKKQQPLIRVTISVDKNDYETMEGLAKDCELSTARLIRQAMSEFIERRMKDNKVSIAIPNCNKARIK